jgi:hypothetical protein
MHDACGIIDTACTMHAVSLTPPAQKGVLFDEKTEGRKSRDTVPFNRVFFYVCFCFFALFCFWAYLEKLNFKIKSSSFF